MRAGAQAEASEEDIRQDALRLAGEVRTLTAKLRSAETQLANAEARAADAVGRADMAERHVKSLGAAVEEGAAAEKAAAIELAAADALVAKVRVCVCVWVCQPAVGVGWFGLLHHLSDVLLASVLCVPLSHWMFVCLSVRACAHRHKSSLPRAEKSGHRSFNVCSRSWRPNSRRLAPTLPLSARS